MWMIGPSGPTARPDGVDRHVPMSFANSVCTDRKSVVLPVSGDRPSGMTPFR